MFVNFNSTFSELSCLDQMAFYGPHLLYLATLSLPIPHDAVCYFLMIALATFIVIIGSYGTVTQPKTAKDPILGKNSDLWDPTDRDNCPLYISLPLSALNLNIDFIDMKTALALPMVAATALFAFNYLIKKLEITYLKAFNYLVVFALVVTSWTSLEHLLSVTLRNVGHWLGLKNNLAYFFKRYKLTLSSGEKLPVGLIEPFDLKEMGMTKSQFEDFKKFMKKKNNVKLIRPTKIKSKKQMFSFVWDARSLFVLPGAIASLALLFWYNPVLRSDYQLEKTNWLVSNYIATMFAITGCIATKVGNFKVSILMLTGLFLYDIYFVFKSPLMEFVAMNLDLSVKLVVPMLPLLLHTLQSIGDKPVHELGLRFALLGLGDIVVPALFASLCLRFDYHTFYALRNLTFHKLRSIGVPKYFTTAIVAYVVALLVTVVISLSSGRGQPALLYIVPALLVSVLTVAKWNGDIGDMWNYFEELESFDLHDASEDIMHEQLESKEVPEFEQRVIVGETTYEFEDSQDESDDTYLIEDDTDEDEEEYDDDDLNDEIAYLLRPCD